MWSIYAIVFHFHSSRFRLGYRFWPTAWIWCESEAPSLRFWLARFFSFISHQKTSWKGFVWPTFTHRLGRLSLFRVSLLWLSCCCLFWLISLGWMIGSGFRLIWNILFWSGETAENSFLFRLTWLCFPSQLYSVQDRFQSQASTPHWRMFWGWICGYFGFWSLKYSWQRRWDTPRFRIPGCILSAST